MEIIRLESSKDAEEIISGILMQKDIWDYLSDDNRNISHITDILMSFRQGNTAVYIVMDNGLPVGMAYYYAMNDVYAEGHQYFLKGYRWAFAIQAIQSILKRFKHDSSHFKKIIGFTPVFNSLALRVAKRAGFKKVGVMPRDYKLNGEHLDSEILIYDLGDQDG